MNFNKPKNENYTAVVVKIKNIIKLENCDNVVSTIIFGSNIIVKHDTQIGDIGIYFPVECKLSERFLSENNLYRDKTKNKDVSKVGYFENNGRIRAIRFRGHQSCGLFMPLDSLSFIPSISLEDLTVGDQFDEINGIEICRKYTIERQVGKNQSKQKPAKFKMKSKLIPDQFRFHESTAHFAKNLHMFSSYDYISITKKLHGTSVVISNILCNRKLNWFERILKRIGVKIADTEYSNVYSSRKVVKNPSINDGGFYNYDVWGEINNLYWHMLPKGVTLYGEIVGFLNNGKYIQNGYDYGCKPCCNELYVYRITYTNIDGEVFEYSHNQIKSFCAFRNIKVVPELFYGKASEFQNLNFFVDYKNEDQFREDLLTKLMNTYLEKNCDICKNTVPAEGIVIRRESDVFQAYKLKSFRFIERETKSLDAGEISIEDSESLEE